MGVGLARLNGFGNAPGLVDSALHQWPRDSLIKPSHRRCNLVMFIHDCCPCTRASLAELAKIMARCPDDLHVQVAVFKPRQTQGAPCRISLGRSAAEIPGVIVIVDPDGKEARRFGALTSGHTFLYDQNGSLLFSGGITAGRGHSGDNRGQEAVLALTADHQNPHFVNSRTNVFGCPLFCTSRP